ncbi:MAG: Imm61 family immunity protein [Mycobacterium sp.]
MASDRPEEVLLHTRVEVCFRSVTLLTYWPAGATDLTSDRIFGDDIRDDVDLPYLQFPWAAEDLAPGYTLRVDAAGLHVLVHHRLGAVAAVPDPALAMITLVPLSRLLGLSAADLRRAFMAEDGAPLLSNGYYAAR